MMTRKLQLVLSFIALISLSVSGQNYIKEFGKVAKDEYELVQYAPDEDAEAVVLFDIASSRFVERERSFEIVYERKTRIKVLSQAGIKWAEIQIPFYQENQIYEKVYDVEAYTYNYENGRIDRTPLEASNMFDEKINASWKVKKLAIPNVKVGSIIEYTYKISSPYVFNLREWNIQWRIPVVYSEYEVRMIPFYNYAFVLQGANKFDFQESVIDDRKQQYGRIEYRDYIHKYVMEDVPAFKSEEFITSVNDYIIKLDFQLAKVIYPNGGSKEILTTWEQMNKDLLTNSDFGGYIKKSERLAKKLILDEIKELTTEKEKFDFVLDYVKSNYSWNKMNGKFASKSPSKFEKEKHGNCADINLYTIGLLNAVGIDAKPVIISTRENGKIKYDYPLSGYFNYVIILANVDGNNLISDATEILSLNTRIPSRCINDKGLVVDKDKALWVDLECQFPSEIRSNFQIEVVDNDLKNTTISIKASEYDALYYRNNYGANTETVMKRLENENYTISSSSISVQNQLDKEKPYILNYTQTSKPEVVNDKIYISPFLKESISDNPLKQNERTYPIDMTYPRKRVYTSTIIIPKGYKVDYTPEEQNYKNDLFELTYKTIEEEDKVTVSFNYMFHNSIYAPSDYAKIKAYFNEIVKKGNEKIVLAKKGENSN